MATEAVKVDFIEAAAPATPGAGIVRTYSKADGLMYSKDDAGVETLMSSGAGATVDHNHTTGGGDGGDLDGARVGDFLEMTEVAAPSTPATGFARIYAKSDGRIYSKDDAGTEYGPFDTAGGGALVGERKPWDVAGTYPLHANGSEFEYADLTAFNVDWTRRNVADADIYTPPGSHTEYLLSAMGDAIYRAVPAATDYKIVAELSENGDGRENMAGIGIVNSSGTGYGFAPYSGSFAHIVITTWDYAGFGNTSAPSGAQYDQYMSGEHVWLIFEQISSTQYQGGVSLDGTSIILRPTANTPTAFTPAYFGFFRFFTGGKAVWRRVHRINLYTSTFP